MRLLTISDLTDPSNDWKPLLAHVAALQDVYEKYRSRTRSSRIVSVFMSGDEDRAPGIHASELCGCLRQVAYSLTGTKKEADEENVNTNMLMRFDLGSAVHAILQDDFQRMCIHTDGRLVFDDEVRINPQMSTLAAEYNFTSSTDGIFTFYDAADHPYLRVGLEIKTMSKDEFAKASQPKEEHIRQATLYQKLLDVPLMWFLYYNKSNSNFTPPTMPWITVFDHNVWNGLESRAKQVHSLLRQGQLPEREEGMPCTWCPYARTCEPAYLRMKASSMGNPSVKPRRLT